MLPFWRNTPFARIILSWIPGIIFGYTIGPDATSLYISCILLTLALFVISKIKKLLHSNLSILIGIGIQVGIFLFGALRITQSLPPSIPLPPDQPIPLCAEINSIQEKQGSTRIEATILKSDSAVQLIHHGITLYIRDSIAVQEGNTLFMISRVNPIRGPMNPNAFDYQAYMSHRGIHYAAYLNLHDLLILNDHPPTNPIKSMGDRLRSILLQANLQPQNKALINALVLGDRHLLDDATSENFANAGVIHVLAVSGLHVGMIYMVLVWCFSFFGKSTILRILRCLLILMLLWIYVGITGGSPSVMRAGVMFSFIAIGELVNKHPNTYNSLFAAAFVLLLYDPHLLFSVGFQLSFTAVLGIVFFQPRFSRILDLRYKILQKTWELMSVSLAAQLATLPFCLYYFHQFPTYFLLANLVVIPLATLLLYATMIGLATSSIPILGEFVFKGIDMIAGIMNVVVEWISKLPGSIITNISFGPTEFSFFFVGLFCFCFAIDRRHKRALKLTLICVSTYFILSGVDLLDRRDHVLIFSAGKDMMIMSVNGDRARILTEDQTSPARIDQVCGPYLMANRLELEQVVFVQNELTFLNNNTKLIVLKDTMNVDYIDCLPVGLLYLRSQPIDQFLKILDSFEPKKVVVDRSSKFWVRKEIQKKCQDLDVEFADLSVDGYLRIEEETYDQTH